MLLKLGYQYPQTSVNYWQRTLTISPEFAKMLSNSGIVEINETSILTNDSTMEKIGETFATKDLPLEIAKEYLVLSGNLFRLLDYISLEMITHESNGVEIVATIINNEQL